MHLNHTMLLEIVDEFKTPVYVYNGDLIKQRYQELFQYIKWPKLRILYAMKANYNLSILKLLKSIGGWLDTVSPAEIILAKKAGFSVDKIFIYSK